MTALAAVAAALVPFWSSHGCTHGHTVSEAHRGLSANLKHHRPFVRRQRVHHFSTCLGTRGAAHRLHVRARRLWGWRRQYAHRWPIRLNGLPAGWVRWARNITFCESRWDRYATNGIHASYFQWNPNTWAAASAGFDAPASAFDASWPHQAVIAIHWAWREGTSQWACTG